MQPYSSVFSEADQAFALTFLVSPELLEQTKHNSGLQLVLAGMPNRSNELDVKKMFFELPGLNILFVRIKLQQFTELEDDRSPQVINAFLKSTFVCELKAGSQRFFADEGAEEAYAQSILVATPEQVTEPS